MCQNCENAYTFVDIESDLAKTRGTLSEIEASIKDFSTSAEGITQFIERIDTLAEDLSSISKRTNKLILTSEDSHKTIKNYLEEIIIDQNFTASSIFQEVIHLRDTLYIVAYATDEETIKIQFKHAAALEPTFILSFRDYYKNITEIYINKDKGPCFSNALFWVNNN